MCAVRTGAVHDVSYSFFVTASTLLGMIIGYLVMDHLERDASQSEEVRHLIYRRAPFACSQGPRSPTKNPLSP